MGASLITHARVWVLCVCSCLPAAAAQFVELTVEIEVDDWSFWFGADRGNPPWSGTAESSIFRKGKGMPIRCVVGTNTWMMEGPFASNARVTYWFTGSNIVERHEITSALPQEKLVRIPGSPVGKSPAIGSVGTVVTESVDGNPGRPVRMADVMMMAVEKVCWLAFCSAPVVKGRDRQIPLPSDLWKQFFPAATKFTNDVILFEDDLGLPATIEVATATGQYVLQYQVRHSTNVLGWNFPTEFYLVQYKPARAPWTNSWEVHLTSKGRVTAIGPGAELKVPEK